MCVNSKKNKLNKTNYEFYSPKRKYKKLYLNNEGDINKKINEYLNDFHDKNQRMKFFSTTNNTKELNTNTHNSNRSKGNKYSGTSKYNSKSKNLYNTSNIKTKKDFNDFFKKKDNKINRNLKFINNNLKYNNNRNRNSNDSVENKNKISDKNKDYFYTFNKDNKSKNSNVSNINNNNTNMSQKNSNLSINPSSLGLELSWKEFNVSFEKEKVFSFSMS